MDIAPALLVTLSNNFFYILLDSFHPTICGFSLIACLPSFLNSALVKSRDEGDGPFVCPEKILRPHMYTQTSFVLGSVKAQL